MSDPGRRRAGVRRGSDRGPARRPAGLLLAALALGLLAPAPAHAHARVKTATPIEHVVMLMQANHSFDNYFGTYPGADGTPKGTCLPVSLRDPNGAQCVQPFHLGDRAVPDLDHPVSVFERQRNGGHMDGFVSAFRQVGAGLHPSVMGYYDQRDIPFAWNVARDYVLFDRFFTSAKAGTLANHMFWVAGAPGVPVGEGVPPGGFRQPTIFDRLEKKGISWKFYVESYDPGVNYRNAGAGPHRNQPLTVPLLDYDRFIDNPKLHAHIADLDQYFVDLRAGKLPAVSYIVTSGSSERPPGSIQAGQQTVRSIISALQASRQWSRSAFVWTYDDWGGWYDHVPPPRVDRSGYGFRVPALLVSPYARRGHIDHTHLDFTSLLKFIEGNWGIAPLASRDKHAHNILSAFDFRSPPRRAELLPGPDTPKPHPLKGRGVVYLLYGLAACGVGVLLLRGRRGREEVIR